jgi:GGDEF domain-containing protein
MLRASEPGQSRFRRAVESYDWTRVDSGLARQPVKVDVGVVSLRMGPVSDRRFIARRLALQLVEHADQLMYEAKSEGSLRVHEAAMQIRNGELAPLGA